MRSHKEHLIFEGEDIKVALAQLNRLAADAIIFAVDNENRLVGSLTDGDIRRGLLKGLQLNDIVKSFIQPNPKYVVKGDFKLEEVLLMREKNFRIIPVLDKNHQVINVINFRFQKSYLPVDVVIMAGGRGERLRPLTDATPKPLLKVGDKPIVEHNIDRLISFGINDFWLSIRYMGEQIVSYLGDGASKFVNIHFVREDKPLGTIGAISQIDNFQHDYILITNSDLLTNLDYEDFFLDFIESDSDFSIVTIPYTVNIPYAVLEMNESTITSFKEKPTYTYYSNGGIYLLKKELVGLVPKNGFYNATDLMETLIAKGYKVKSYPLRGYWLDIGKHEDYVRAQEDIKHLKL